ncbi:TonB-dependent receptor [Sessilibacter corallicola]|uniref:TonB-dependent receptor n=1 Tax=Sessilibacter corallicola TaxID=2904075 RepID=UPI001E5C715F|nr:TonB-dependent receptor [Sessilibacter corallicola]MCE2029013.1 TonB-dependent receptor plug domain-containing protein [Sessilibacter corallicola]
MKIKKTALFNTIQFPPATLAMVIAGVIAAHGATAAETSSILEEVVVTGNPGGLEKSKIDSSFAISTVSADDITKFSPKSTADLLKSIPGVVVESSGGVSGANIFVRGFPASGDAEFVTVQVNGAPIFPPPTLSFLENTTLFRIDDTIERVEGLRGGPNPVLSNGQPGLTTNFVLKQGGEETEGSVKYTTSDYDLQRFDGVVSGALSDGLYYMVGGYISSSPGIRDAGFNAEEGRQFTVNITKELDDGEINFWLRDTDDHGTWYLPAPIGVPGVDSEFTYVGTLNRQTTIEFGPDNTSQSFNFGDGRGWDGNVFGGSVEFDLSDGWTFVDRFSYTSGDANTLGLVPSGQARQIGDLGLASATTVGTGRTLDADTYVQRVGFWVVQKEIEAFTNDLTLSKTWDNVSFTVGYYASTYSSDDWWSIGNDDRYLEVAPGGEITDIDCTTPGILADLGCGFNFDLNSSGDGRTDAFYVASEWFATDNITLDIGLRRETHEIEYTADQGLDGTIDNFVDYSETELSWTLGANLSLNENSGVFFRVNSGSKMPFFDDFRDNFDVFQSGGDLIKDIDQYELGYKLATDNIGFYATTFFNTVDGAQSVTQPGAPVQVTKNEAYGLELDADYVTDYGFSLTLNATIQETEITESTTAANEGNEAPRQPGWQLRVTPSYEFDISEDVIATVYGSATVIDDRFSDPENQQVLDSYEKFDLGVILEVSENLNFQLAIDNITDEDALTEGDPRVVGVAENGRTILPRSAKFSVGYTF